ncbi:hypothetical protein AK812_SmicGene41902 [Symbiodinium microadriaticum]|uniref:Uncharacterized protein n=1 Tax=Symbiodinium microadriaticum TaxID=2951 RepID=A0A1Q9C4W5_SYMMI|nr:hypothetical protein AK812_SmicGene41902 [Symbiodinium microadriaticum]
MTRPLTSTLADPTQRPLPVEEADPKVGVGGCKADGKKAKSFEAFPMDLLVVQYLQPRLELLLGVKPSGQAEWFVAMGSGASRPPSEKPLNLKSLWFVEFQMGCQPAQDYESWSKWCHGGQPRLELLLGVKPSGQAEWFVAMGSGASRPPSEKYQASAEASSEEAKVTKTPDRPLPPEPTAQTAAGESAATASSGRDQQIRDWVLEIQVKLHRRSDAPFRCHQWLDVDNTLLNFARERRDSKKSVPQVLSALDRARATALRSLSNRARRLLAESAVIHELGPGASLGGVEAWYHGQCLVLSGQASVMLYPPRPTVRAIPEDEVAPSEPMLEVALVKRGDTFGWHRQHKADLTDEEILLQPLVFRDFRQLGLVQQTVDLSMAKQRGLKDKELEEAYQRVVATTKVGQRGERILLRDDRADINLALRVLELDLVVPANQKLKFARLEDSDDHRGEHRGSKGASGHALKAQKSASKTKLLSKEDEHAARPLQGLHANGVTSTFNFLPSSPTSSFLAQLWLTSTPPLEGIADNAAANGGLLPRAHFQAALWTPLCDCLDQLNEEIRRRQRAKYRIHDCFPLQGHQIVELKHYIIHLTEIWYGARRGGNLSILYSWFVDAMGVLGVTAYSYDDLPVDKSSDAWATVIDGDARRRALQGRTGMDSAYVATGGVAQKQGRSAIDNTVLRNVFYPWEARELLVGRMARKFLSRLLALRQRSILRRLAQHLQLDVLHLAQDARTHRSLRSILAATSDEEIKVLGLDPQDRLLLLLRRTGAEIAGFGQLDEGMQRSVWETAKTLLKETATPLQQEPAEGTPKDVFARFVVWSREYPGEFFEHDKSRHVTVKIAGMFSRRIVVVKRSAMERMTLARYFPLTWKRQQPLWGSASTGHFQVRPAGVKEGSHVRANECPYAGLHGMALSAGGFASDQRCNPDRKIVGYTLLMELQWIRDPQANIENWYITDIEKIIQEAWQLNPHGPASIMLTGEKFLAVGQNPKVGSSIRQTQHTQLAQGSWKNYPVLQIPASRILASEGFELCLEAADVPDTPGAEVGAQR